MAKKHERNKITLLKVKDKLKPLHKMKQLISFVLCFIALYFKMLERYICFLDLVF